MIARAPGKVVITGAYAVLEGAPALVAAVDRYAIADASRRAARVTPEVAAAFGAGAPAPWFDASELRQNGRKLGLGSSAAILVASLAAAELAARPGLSDETLASRILDRALGAHRQAQGGGSGIDVAASCHGGVIRCRLGDGGLQVKPSRLPDGIVIEVWASPREASTPALLERVRALKDRDRPAYDLTLAELDAASEAALAALDAAAFTDACRAMLEGLDRLGQQSGAPIVTPDVRAFDAAAREGGGVVVPSGAGGGDAVLHVGRRASDEKARLAARTAGLTPLALVIGARGVHAAASAPEVR